MTEDEGARLEVWIAGNSPLLINVPHAGTYIPPALRATMTPLAQCVPDADWHVHLLYGFAVEHGASLMAATHARYVVDLNRDPQGGVLYPGADNSELVPLRSFDLEPLYAEAPDVTEVMRRTQRYWTPYHARLRQRLDAIRDRHGYALLLDAHSIRSRVPRFFDGRLPDLNLGTADGASCAPALADAAFAMLQDAADFTAVRDGRFKGGYITRHYGRPQAGVHALQLEIAQACYMDEQPPWPWNPQQSQPLEAVLRRLVDALQRWKP